MTNEINIRRRDGSLIGSYPGASIREAVENAVRSGSNLSGANLSYTHLFGANLFCANLFGTNLTGANLYCAYLSCANLSNADLSRANLTGANLTGAYLSGAKIDDGSLLAGPRPVVQYGPVGRAGRYVVGYVTDKGLRVRAGCFFGDEAAFVAAVRKTHGTSEHSREYRAVLDLFRAHAVLFPGEVTK